MLKVLVVEDNIEEMNYCCSAITSLQSQCSLLRADSYSAALEMINSHEIDIFFIDVRLPDQNGFTLAKTIRQFPAYQLTPIVFITGAQANQLEIHRRYHYYEYIEKPYTLKIFQERIGPVLDALRIQKGKRKLSAPSEKLLFINNGSIETLIKFNTLFFAEVSNRKLILYTKNGIFENIKMKLDEFIEYVNEKDFQKCHRSYAVNLQTVSGIQQVARRSWDFSFKEAGSLTCPMSLTYYQSIKEHLALQNV